MQTQEPGWSRDAPPSVVQATTRTQERALFTTATFLPKLQQLSTLLHNGMFYQTVGNAVGALVAYSNAATYCYLLRREVAVVVGGDPDAGEPRLGGAERLHRYLGLLEQKLLGYVEGLQQRVRAALASASASAPPADKDPKDEQPLSCADMAEVRPEAMRITFADVVGMEREKEALVDAFLHPLVYPNLYPKLARGVLLYGPPGTGKTYLARAAVSELQLRFPQDVGVLFFDPTGATLKGKFVGETEKRIVGAFTCAARRACEATDAYAASHGGRRKKFVSVLFIDEFDSIAGDRGTDTTGLVANSVNTLLQMMDGVQSFENVAVIGATNYPWGLDSAVLRRFAEHVFVRLPGVDDIAQLLQRELRSKLRGKPADLYCYCADTLTRRRVHAPSEHMRGASCGAPPAADSLQRAATEPPPATAQQGGGTAEDAGEKDPVPFVDTTSYLQGARMREVAQAMYDGHASNADVATVVNRAFTAANGAALRRGSFTRFSVTTRPDAPPLTFALSNFTKLRAPEGAPLALLPALRAMRQTRAATAVALRSLAEPPSASAPAPFAQMPASLHVAGRALPNRASLTLDSGEVFLHLQYLLLAPTELLFDEPGIGDLYVHSEDVRADGSTADTVRVIFTRALRVSNAAVEAAAAADEGGGEDDVAGLGALPSPKAVYDTLRPLLEPFTQSVRERRGAEAASTLTSAALALGLFERASVVAALARGDLAAATSAMPASDFSASLLQSGEARRDAAAVHGEWLRAAVALTAFAREFVGAAPLEAPVKARVQAVVGASGPVARPSKLAGLLDVLTQAALERSIRHAMGTASAAAAHPLQKLLARAEAPPMKALPTALPASLRTTPFAHNKTFYFRSSVNLRDPAWGTTKFSTSVTSALVSLPVKALAAAASTVSYLLMGGGGGAAPDPKTLREYLNNQRVSALDYLLNRVTAVGLTDAKDDEEVLETWLRREAPGTVQTQKGAIRWWRVLVQARSNIVRYQFSTTLTAVKGALGFVGPTEGAVDPAFTLLRALFGGRARFLYTSLGMDHLSYHATGPELLRAFHEDPGTTQGSASRLDALLSYVSSFRFEEFGGADLLLCHVAAAPGAEETQPQDRANLYSFHMDADLLLSANAAHSSSYDPALTAQLEAYDRDRSAFMEKRQRSAPALAAA